MRHKLLLITLLYLLTLLTAGASPLADEITLDSEAVHDGSVRWIMRKASDVTASGSVVSQPEFDTVGWMDAVVPGTVLTSLVYNDVYPEPYYGLNNKIESELIPDIAKTGPDFYTYWFRAAFDVPESFAGKTVWLKSDGINYRSEIWINGRLADTTKGMFMQRFIDITDYIRPGKPNVIAVKVYPVDAPGSKEPKSWGAPGEFRNGGNGEIGLNTTMLMSVGWDFSFMDGIRDRNTGIWRGMSLFTTGKIALRHPFVRSALNVPACDVADETVSVEVVNATSGYAPIKCTVRGDIVGENITFEKTLDVYRGEEKTVTFTPADFPQLRITNPRLWWPVNKGEQNLYELKLTVEVNGEVSDSLTTRFGIRDITSDRNTPDGSRVFYVNGKRLFIRGSNWIPEG
ncbi:MAG: glycoside hydrolase family 2, partial [Duncaniella sp.]|nr:glycoside hydrolase family 2 [Duncaniella sp.]